MTWGLTAVAGATLVSGYMQSEAAGEAADIQAGAAEVSEAGVQARFEETQALLAPFVTAGTTALAEQEALLGLAGPEAEQAAITRIQESPTFQALTEQGETALLQQASATGGLRGGNIQAALAQFRPQMLSQMIEQQYGRLGGITQTGQASAARGVSASETAGAQITALQQQAAAAQAGGVIGAAAPWGDVAGTAAFMYGVNKGVPTAPPRF